jgi:methyl-accepting chemotaxis protein
MAALLAIIAVFLTLLLAASLYVTRAVTGPLGEAVRAAGLLAQGDVSARIEMASRDEADGCSRPARMTDTCDMARTAEGLATGDLTVRAEPRSDGDRFGRAFAEMLSRLAGIVAELRTMAAGLASAAGQVSATASSFSADTSEVAAAVQESLSSLEEMSASIGQNADNSRERRPLPRRAGLRERGRGARRSRRCARSREDLHIEEIAYQTTDSPERGHRGREGGRARRGFKQAAEVEAG